MSASVRLRSPARGHPAAGRRGYRERNSSVRVTRATGVSTIG